MIPLIGFSDLAVIVFGSFVTGFGLGCVVSAIVYNKVRKMNK